MALVKLKPTSPGRRGMVKVVNPDLYKGRPHTGLIEKKSKSAGPTTTVTSLPVIWAVVTSSTTGLLTSVVSRTGFPRKSSVSSTTRTAARILHCSAMQMASAVTSSPAKAWR